ncbi:MAG: chaperone NapD [Pseudomonadales bacterium]
MEIHYDRGDAEDNAVHIISMVLMARPEHLETLQRDITQVSGSEIHACDPSGKVVVTLEAPSNRALTTGMDQLQKLPNLVTSSLVYHQIT